ncbi:MAG: hypothetical protein ACYSUV_01980 [Planctomycetota bacterium]|jgi:hypothetical protein
MKGTLHMIAEEIVANLLQEDRIDDLISRYPKLGLDRFTLEGWRRFDPTGDRGKYLPWMVKQVADGKMRMPQDSDHLRDQLRTFERLVSIPGFQGSRDIQSYDWPSLDQTVTQNLELRSRSEQERAARRAKKKDVSAYEHKRGVTEVAKEGEYSVLEIKDAVALSWWGWQAYSKDNPNWDGKPLTPPPPGAPESLRDGLWCIRYPTYGTDYIRREPTKAFYMVLKNGGPIAGILLKDGQAKSLHNKSITLGLAEEIYPVMSGILDKAKEMGIPLEGEVAVFNDLRFVHGEVKPGEQFRGEIGLEGSSITELPPNLTFDRSLNIEGTAIRVIPAGTKIGHNLSANNSALEYIDPTAKIGSSIFAANTQLKDLPPNLTVQNLNISNTPMTELPSGLKVKGQLNIEGTFIKAFPADMEIADDTVTWSEPMTVEEIKKLFFNKTLPKMRQNFEQEEKIMGLNARQKAQKWRQFKKELWQHFLTSPEVKRYVETMFLYKEPGKAK